MPTPAVCRSPRSLTRPGPLTAALVVALALIAAFTIAPPRAGAVSPDIVISQIYGGGGNTGATLKNDFIELYNRGTTAVSVTGWSVQYASATGSTWQVTSLSGTIQPGRHYLVQQAAGAGGSVSLPCPDATGSVSMSATAGKVALVTNTVTLSGTTPLPNAAIRDFVGYGTGASAFEGTGPAPTLSNTTAALRAGGGATDSDNNNADFSSGPPNPRNGTFGVVPVSVEIHDIQGSGPISPFVEQFISTTGVVTGRKSNAFFIQALAGDADPTTSEGVLVFTSSAPPSQAAVGNVVKVVGTVQEFVPSQDFGSPPLTEIGFCSIELQSTGSPLPAPVTLTTADTSPSGAFDQLEKFEGMRVTVNSLSVVGPTQGSVTESTATSNSNGVFYGVITGIVRPLREPGIEVPDPLPAGAPSGVQRFDANPERLRVDSDGQVAAPKLEVTAGATVTNLVGPLDYAFRTYTILPDPPPSPAPDVSGNVSAAAVPAPIGDEFTIASWNVERLFDTANDPAISEPVLTATAFNNRLAKASMTIRNLMATPDILGVVEVENLATLQALATRVNDDAVADGQPNPLYQAFLVEGNDIGGIDSGFLVKSSRVNVIDVVQEGKTETFINPNTGLPETLNDRPPLVLRAEIQRPPNSPVPVTVIVNHLRSLSNIDDPLDGARVRAKRRAQAEFLANLIQARQALNPDERVISVGDYNAFQFNDGYVDSIGTIKGTPAPVNEVVLASADLVNPDLAALVDLAPADQRYSFVFDGNAQVLDHVLITEKLLPRLRGFSYARSNADFPESFRNDPTRPERLSDHDAAVAYFSFPPPAADLTVAKNATPEPVVAGSTLSSSLTVENNGPDPAFDVQLIDALPSGATISAVTSPAGWSCTTGSTVACTAASLAAGATAEFTITVEVACELPDGAEITNTAGVSSTTADPQEGNNDASVDSTVSNPPPAIEAPSVSASSLWSPNHKMVDVTVSYGVTDNCEEGVTCVIGVASNEPVNDLGDGDTAPDWEVVDAHHVRLRAERSGTGNGRVYTITITCTDSAGGSTSRTVVVRVDHH